MYLQIQFLSSMTTDGFYIKKQHKMYTAVKARRVRHYKRWKQYCKCPWQKHHLRSHNFCVKFKCQCIRFRHNTTAVPKWTAGTDILQENSKTWEGVIVACGMVPGETGSAHTNYACKTYVLFCAHDCDRNTEEDKV